MDPQEQILTTRKRTYVLLRTAKDHSIVADSNLTAEKVRAHVSDHESLVFSCLRLQRFGEARKLDSVNGLIVAVAAPSPSQPFSSEMDAGVLFEEQDRPHSSSNMSPNSI